MTEQSSLAVLKSKEKWKQDPQVEQYAWEGISPFIHNPELKFLHKQGEAVLLTLLIWTSHYLSFFKAAQKVYIAIARLGMAW
jgi:hypothetical protein